MFPHTDDERARATCIEHIRRFETSVPFPSLRNPRRVVVLHPLDQRAMSPVVAPASITRSVGTAAEDCPALEHERSCALVRARHSRSSHRKSVSLGSAAVDDETIDAAVDIAARRQRLRNGPRTSPRMQRATAVEADPRSVPVRARSLGRSVQTLDATAPASRRYNSWSHLRSGVVSLALREEVFQRRIAIVHDSPPSPSGVGSNEYQSQKHVENQMWRARGEGCR
jgi:hypothetical protein